MATGYGPWLATDDWRAIVEANVTSDTSDSATVRVVAKIQSAYITSSGARGRTGRNGSYGSWSNVGVKPGGTYTMRTDSYTVAKTHSAQSVNFQAQGNVSVSGYSGSGTSTAQVTLTIGAKASYAVTYNANGGSGAPGAGTKWYGETYAISTTRPTRANYNFLGWATSSSATSAAYQPGGSYTGNAALTLYAVWQLAATPPSVTALAAYRSDSSGERVDDATEDTTHVTVEYGWSVDSGATSRRVQISLGGAAQAAIALAANSGTGSVTYEKALGRSATLVVSATLTDSTHGLSATRAVTVPVVFKPFSMANRGLSAAFFGVAGAAWSRILKVFGNVRVQDDSITAGANPTYDTYGRGLYLCDADAADIGYARAMKLASGLQGLQLEAIRSVGGANYYNTVNLLIGASGAKTVVVSAPAAWRSAISAAARTWTEIGYTTGTGLASFNAEPYAEMLIVAIMTNPDSGSWKQSSLTFPVNSTIIPFATDEGDMREVWMGGRGDSTAGYANSGMRMVCNVNSHCLRGVTANDGPTNKTSGMRWYVYAR